MYLSTTWLSFSDSTSVFKTKSRTSLGHQTPPFLKINGMETIPLKCTGQIYNMVRWRHSPSSCSAFPCIISSLWCLWDVPSLVNAVHYIPMCTHMFMTFQKIRMRVYSVLATNHPLVCIWLYVTKMKNSLFWSSFSNSDFPPVTFRVDAKMFGFIPYAIFSKQGKRLIKLWDCSYRTRSSLLFLWSILKPKADHVLLVFISVTQIISCFYQNSSAELILSLQYVWGEMLYFLSSGFYKKCFW